MKTHFSSSRRLHKFGLLVPDFSDSSYHVIASFEFSFDLHRFVCATNGYGVQKSSLYVYDYFSHRRLCYFDFCVECGLPY